MRKVLTNWKMSTCKDGVVIKPNKSVLQAKSPNRPEGDFRVKTLEEILKEKATRMSASGLGASDVRGPGNAPDSSKGGTPTTFNVEASSKIPLTSSEPACLDRRSSAPPRTDQWISSGFHPKVSFRSVWWLASAGIEY
ncbi:hypothetical protein DPEC_G00372980 [Dallia pectoralis]|nr:hypothetical protein DPEC_G00372980 [Dallia pectoralis]